MSYSWGRWAGDVSAKGREMMNGYYRSFTTLDLLRMYAEAMNDRDNALARRSDNRAGIAVSSDEPALMWQRADARASRLYGELAERLEAIEAGERT